ncbi:MAG TPA: hypothetical protein VEI26_05350 [Terriglobales bacterium]|nr:hypothetical protein [Terriglobales bacterium]
MSIQKKSLISNRQAVKKALIASQPESEQSNALKANSLTAQSMKSKRFLNHKRFKVAVFRTLKGQR